MASRERERFQIVRYLKVINSIDGQRKDRDLIRKTETDTEMEKTEICTVYYISLQASINRIEFEIFEYLKKYLL